MNEKITCQFCGEVLPRADAYHDIADCAFTLHKRVLELEAENAELREGRTLYDTYMSDEAMSLIIASKQALEAEVAVLKEERRWIPVSERLPDAYEKVIALAKDCMNVDWVLPKELREVGKGAFARLYNVTHWMPLPEPPEVQE